QNNSLGSDDNVERWEWDFGDGQLSNERDPQHSYQNPGVYPVSLTVINKNGCIIPVQKSVKISSRPVADFIIKSIDCDNGVVVFEDKSFSSTADINNGIGIKKREWLFGDGTRYIASAADAGGNTRVMVTKGKLNDEDIVQQDKAYVINQLYQVSLTITDSTDCASTLVRTISFRTEDQPQVDFSFEKACAGTLTQFTDQSTMSDQAIGPIDTWVWKVFSPNGQLIDSTGNQNPGIIFPVPGIYQVELSARYSGACASSIVKSVEVLESSTSLFTTSIDLGPAPLTVSFTNQSSEGESFEWNFGNGQISTQESPTITYEEPGVYIVQFQSRNTNGCGTISFASITVLADSLTTALEPLGDEDLSFYPNPVNEVLFIELKHSSKDVQLEMMNPMAQRFPISYERIQTDLLKVELRDLPRGLYFIYIETER
ncbi:MAG: PKD domain-containing protein, partial [Bacteroidota bacterium]